MAKDNKYTDLSSRLNPTTLFGFSIFLGIVFILTGTYWKSPYLNLVLPVGVMIVYTYVINQDTSDALSIEQKADSVYYMGFILTLVAMTASLVVLAFEDQLKFNSVVINFGLALATTILGLTIRIIWLQLSSQSLSDAESILKERIIKRSQELQDQTEKVVGSMTALSNQLSKVSEPLKDNFNQLTSALDVSQEVNQNLVDLNKSIGQVSQNLGSITSSTERLEMGVSRLTQTLSSDAITDIESLSSTANNANPNIKELNQEILSTADSFSNLNQAISSELLANIKYISNSANEAKPAIDELDRKISSTTDSLNESLKTLQNNIAKTDNMITQSEANMKSAGSILNRLTLSVRRFFERN